MHWDSSTYDDDRELTSYVFHNYAGLFTPLESLAQAALFADHSPSDKISRKLHENFGTKDNAEVAAALADGEEAFCKRVRDRILEERVDDIVINRCSECSRVVATPLAQQCLWCGHDWHAGVSGD